MITFNKGISMKSIILLSVVLTGCNLTGLQVAGAIADGVNDSRGNFKVSRACKRVGYLAYSREVNKQLIAGTKYVDYNIANIAQRLAELECN